MRNFVAKTIGTVLSRGETYEPVPAGRHVNASTASGYLVDFSAKTRSTLSPEVLLPAALAQLALGWWERWLDGDDRAHGEFERIAEMLLKRAEQVGPQLLWRYGVAVQKYRLEPSWASALAQGQAASVLLRRYLASGDDSNAAAARAAVAPLVDLPPSRLVTWTAYGPILEELPSVPASHVLNGWLSALWGVREVAVVLDDADAKRTYEDSMSCLLTYLPAYDVGWWTKYSLYPHPIEDLAKPIYHRFHVDQLRSLGAATGIADVITTAARWDAYDTRLNRVRALSQKAAFVAARRVRERR